MSNMFIHIKRGDGAEVFVPSRETAARLRMGKKVAVFPPRIYQPGMMEEFASKIAEGGDTDAVARSLGISLEE